jgi:hypothetical protein
MAMQRTANPLHQVKPGPYPTEDDAVMCGMVGIMGVSGARAISRDLLSRMNEVQHHRGPDEGGLHLEPRPGLGHRRLSIIDLSTRQQPLFKEDGSVVVYNGEIYNDQELMPIAPGSMRPSNPMVVCSSCGRDTDPASPPSTDSRWATSGR